MVIRTNNEHQHEPNKTSLIRLRVSVVCKSFFYENSSYDNYGCKLSAIVTFFLNLVICSSMTGFSYIHKVFRPKISSDDF